MQTLPSVLAVTILAAWGLVLVACGTSSKSSTPPPATASTGTAGATATTAAGAAATSGALPPSTGPADKSLAPVEIGLINQQGGAAGDPGYTNGAEVARDYINNELGGINGHPVKLDECFIDGTPSTGQACARQMANNSNINSVLFGLEQSGDDAIDTTLAGVKPVTGCFPATAALFANKDAYCWAPGSLGVIAGDGYSPAKYLTNVHSAALLIINVPSVKQAAEALIKPFLDKAGIKVTEVPLDPASTDVVAPLTAAGADKADLLIPVVSNTQCVAIANAYQQLSLTSKVVTTGACVGPDVQKSAGAEIKGWYEVQFGEEANTDNPATKAVFAKFDKYGPAKNSSAYSVIGFSSTLNLAEIMQKIGYANLTADSVRQAIKAYHGPVLLISPSENCGANPAFPSVCTTKVRAYQWNGSKLIDATGGQYFDPFGS